MLYEKSILGSDKASTAALSLRRWEGSRGYFQRCLSWITDKIYIRNIPRDTDWVLVAVVGLGSMLSHECHVRSVHAQSSCVVHLGSHLPEAPKQPLLNRAAAGFSDV